MRIGRPSLLAVSVAAVSVLALSGLVAGCVGPPAPDAELCRDVVDRLCAAPVCDAMTRTGLDLGDGSCALRLKARAGCDAESFSFGASLTRDRMLECRLPLVRASQSVGAHPDCTYVEESFALCPDLVSWLGGVP